jgi:Ca2+:H+ antiporter
VVHLVLFVSYLCFFYHTQSDEEKDEDKDKYRFVRNILVPGSIAMAVTPEIAKASFSPELSWQLRELSRKLREESQKQCGKTPKRPVAVNGILLCACVVVTTFVSLYVVESLEAPHHTLGLSKSFVGLILVPIVYGAAQHVGAAVRAGRKSATHEGTDWIIETALDSSIRISLFILPCVVLLGWALNEPNMSLLFDSFQVILLGIAISLVNYIMHSGSAYW